MGPFRKGKGWDIVALQQEEGVVAVSSAHAMGHDWSSGGGEYGRHSDPSGCSEALDLYNTGHWV